MGGYNVGSHDDGQTVRPHKGVALSLCDSVEEETQLPQHLMEWPT